ncbi:helix-turn-helix transcriptional regulator [Streptomyces erythrochromogenes]|uniref:helix-turn-helix transcriptional regulator n=1 Tax=Streptomyces erythrochromogenes TaxID=285574 RepID=UPI003821685A
MAGTGRPEARRPRADRAPRSRRHARARRRPSPRLHPRSRSPRRRSPAGRRTGRRHPGRGTALRHPRPGRTGSAAGLVAVRGHRRRRRTGPPPARRRTGRTARRRRHPVGRGRRRPPHRPGRHATRRRTRRGGALRPARGAPAPRTVRRPGRLPDALAAGGPVRITELAARTGVSAGRLGHLFGEQLGLPFPAWVRWARLRAAMDAARGGANLTEAAHAAGFADGAHLTRTFRAMFGITPSRALGGTHWQNR